MLARPRHSRRNSVLAELGVDAGEDLIFAEVQVPGAIVAGRLALLWPCRYR